jgi:hypothetical protein
MTWTWTDSGGRAAIKFREKRTARGRVIGKMSIPMGLLLLVLVISLSGLISGLISPPPVFI